ncbi:MAG: hypothetical protein ACI9N1_000362 [Flavobacteriales bacterium]|jgi:hypothetical protein
MKNRRLKEFGFHPISFSDALSKGTFRAICINVVAGNKADFLIDVGWHHYHYASIEFIGRDGKRLRSSKSARAKVKRFLIERAVLIRTKMDKNSFGRFPGEVWFEKHDSVAYDNTIEIMMGKVKRRFVSISEVLTEE